MQSHPVILANEPRLLRDALRRIVKSVGLEVAGVVQDPARLAPAAGAEAAPWVIVSLGPGGELSGMAETLLGERSVVGVVALAPDGRQAKVKRGDAPARDLIHLSLEDLLALLRGGTIADG